MVDPFSLVNVLGFGRAECPEQSKAARKGTPGVFTINLAKRGKVVGLFSIRTAQRSKF